jgi:LacI family transcriptional regulator
MSEVWGVVWSMAQPGNSMHITLQDVARVAGVSTKTVSRVVNNQGEISAETRARVQTTIDQLGYRPNILARSLVSQRSYTLGVAISGVEYYGPSRILSGVEHESYELGYSLLFSMLPDPDVINVAPVLDSFVARRVDGIVWAVPEIDNNRTWIQPAHLENLPPIVFLSMTPRPGLAIVSNDNRQGGGAQATQHLIDIGRRKIGVISGPLGWWEARERLVGCQAVLEQAGIPPSPTLVAEGDWSASSGARCMRQLLENHPDIDAVFVGNDQMALGALGVVHQFGRRIPEDIAVVGFDNIPESASFWPPLTTIQHPLFEAGCLSVQILQKLIELKLQNRDHVPAMPTLLTTELIVRASTVGFGQTD